MDPYPKLTHAEVETIAARWWWVRDLVHDPEQYDSDTFWIAAHIINVKASNVEATPQLALLCAMEVLADYVADQHGVDWDVVSILTDQ